MKKITKLNNKGFTLIELLAVIVILAVVMGIATTSVLSAMNNSRKSSLQDSAVSAADAFRVAYAEQSMMTGTRTVLGISYDTLSEGTAVALTDAATSLNITAANYDLSNSYVKLDTSTNVFTVCMVANKTGSYYVDAAKKTSDVTPTGTGKLIAANNMWACSDHTNSWT